MDRHLHHRTTSPGSLCTNCLHAPECVQRKAANGRVLFCELHAVAEGPRTLMAVQSGLPQYHAAITGLCATCDHRTHCTLRNPERTVLHCDHFE